MKKVSKNFFIFIIIITMILLLATSMILIGTNNKNDDIFIQTIQGVDKKNESNISCWEQIPIVNQYQLSKGLTGGEGGQWPLCITGDNKDGQLMFYATDVGGVYKSEDGGKSWNKTLKGLYSKGACTVQIDPNNKNKIILFGINGTSIVYTTGIYLSEDAGNTWNFIQHFPVYGYRNTVEGIAFDKNSYDVKSGCSNIIYLSLIEKNDYLTSQLTDDNKGLYRSDDGGYTWTRINSELGDAIVKVDSLGNLYVANYSGLYRSINHGDDFEKLFDGEITGLDIVNDNIYFLQCETENNYISAIYKINNGQIIKVSELLNGDVENGGKDLGNVNMCYKDWQYYTVIEGNDTKYVYHYSNKIHKVMTLKVSPVNENNMIMVLNNESYHNLYQSIYSNDGGLSWKISTPQQIKEDTTSDDYIEDYNFLPFNCRKMVFYWSPIDENIVWDFENDWASQSTNAGKTFLWNSNGINGILCGGKFNFNVINPDIMYFGSQDYNGALTIDGGKTWKYINLSQNNWGGFVYGGYAASESVLFGGISAGWYEDRYLAISFDGGNTVKNYSGNNLYKLNSGYKKRLNQQLNYVSYQSKIDSNILFCGSLRSEDFGYTWTQIQNITGVFAQDDNGFLFGINDTLGQVVVSKDLGSSWQEIINPKDLNQYWNNYICYISDLAYDGENKIIYITAEWSKLFAIYLNDDFSLKKVEDLTLNVPQALTEREDIISNLSSYYPRRLLTIAVDPNNTDIIYVGGSAYPYRSNTTTFRSCDRGKTFYILNAESDNSITQGVQGGSEPVCLRVNEKTGDLWCAGGCLGFSKINAPYETERSTQKPLFEIKLNLNGGEYFTSKIYVYENRRLMLTDESVKQGFKFLGWFSDKDFKNKYQFNLVKSNIIIYAKWERIID